MRTTKVAESHVIDIYDDPSVQTHVGLSRDQVLWDPQRARDIVDVWSAARYCIDLLRSRPEVLRRFPRALSDGPDGRFARWLLNPRPPAAPLQVLSSGFGRVAGRLNLERMGLDRTSLDHWRPAEVPARARAHIAAAFARLTPGRVADVVLSRPDIRKAFPLGFTPMGHAGLLLWFVTHGCQEEAVRLEEVWWFLLCCAEDPAHGIPRTYLFDAAWQERFPDALTVFGGHAFAAWLTQVHQLPETLVDPATWTALLTPAQQIRLAWRHRADWREAHPRAFATEAAARALLEWLRAPDAALPAEARAWCAQLDIEATVQALAQPGVTVLGHFCYPSGLRTSTLSIVDGLRRRGVGVALRDVRTDQGEELAHSRYDGLELYETTLFHVQPEPLFSTAYRRADLCPHTPPPYRVGYWYWELDEIPAGWTRQAAMLDEVWTATRFVAEALRRRLAQPVVTMFPGLELPAFTPRPRSYFGLPESGEFLFVFVFHMASVMERKNPMGLIEAFRAAFQPEDPVRLVLKTSFGDQHPAQIRALHAAADGRRITVIDRMFDAGEVIALVRAADGYVSLHRSEGLGLTMAEAMLLGKPVIATGYSGNTDFMDRGNSLLVDHRLVDLDRTHAPYEAGARWAEPSVAHAAQLMRRVYENQDWAAELGARAQADATSRMSLEASGQRMKERLMQIAAGRPGPAFTRLTLRE